MCDQLTSLAVEFDTTRMKQLFLAGLRWSAAHPFPYAPSASKERPTPWANSDIFPASIPAAASRDDKENDVTLSSAEDVATLWTTARPWGLGQIRAPTSLLQKALGHWTRRPGMIMRVDEDTNKASHEPLLNTGERIHSSVRVRLACGGLGMDDACAWTCEALTESDEKTRLWKLGRSGPVGSGEVLSLSGARTSSAQSFGPDQPAGAYAVLPSDGIWQWKYAQSVDEAQALEEKVPQFHVLPEEPLVGPCERLLLALTAGRQDVWKYSESKGA